MNQNWVLATQNRFEQALDKNLDRYQSHSKLIEAMRYSALNGGKRIRPLLSYATGLIFDVPLQHLDVYACALEMIHVYSLIHDDLPAMDNDDYRRGKLTSHKKWGEAEAILAGDALLPLGIQWIAQGSNSAELVKIITQAVGPNGMVGGQYLDIDSTNNESVAGDADFINKMEWLKTGCLIQASVEMAAVYAKATDIEQVKLIDYAKAFGRSYQIYDDLVDVVETSEEAGKATHKDQEEGKNNTLTLLGIDKSRKELRDLIKQAKDDLHGLNGEILAGFLDLYQKVL